MHDTNEQPVPRAPAYENDYTSDPDAGESDRTLGRTPLYQEEAGARPGLRSRETLRPCTRCQVSVITGRLDNGTTVLVEPQTAMYTMVWHSREALPTLKEARGYPAHRCRT
jgi:hypothetical protein